MPDINTDPCQESTASLLKRFADDREEAAFRDLVDRYLPVVMAAALRRTGGQRLLAEEAAQRAFCDLARRAATLGGGDRLGGWLHQRTVRAAADLMKSEHRRHAREREAARRAALDQFPAEASATLTPHLDDALSRLRAADRDALVLRYLENRPLQSVGHALGLSEDSAQKRVSRALEKLRRLLSREGAVPLAATVLACFAAGRSQAASGILTPSFKTSLTAHALAAKLPPLAALGHFLLAGTPRFAAGLSAAAAVWAWPLVTQHRAVAARLQDTAPAPLPVRGTPDAIPLPPAFPVIARPGAALTIDAITRELTALCEGPFSEAAKLHAQVLVEHIPAGQEGTVILAMHRRLTRAGLLNDERLWIGPGRLGQQWAVQDPQATTAFLSKLMDRIQQDGDWAQWIDRSNWSPVISEAGKCFATRDPAGYLAWEETQILTYIRDEGRLAWRGGSVALACALAPDKGVDFYIRLSNALPGGSSLFIANDFLGNIADPEVLRMFLGKAGEIKSLTRRQGLRGDIIRKMAAIDWPAARALVEAMPKGERALHADSVAFPPGAADSAFHADWWVSVQKATSLEYGRIAYLWALRGDAPGLVRWLEQRQSGPDLTNSLLVTASKITARIINDPASIKHTVNTLNVLLSSLETCDPAGAQTPLNRPVYSLLLKSLERMTLPPENAAAPARLRTHFGPP